MHFVTAYSTLLCAASTAVLALPSPDSPSIAPYKINSMETATLIVPNLLGGPERRFNGTVEEIYQQILAIDPNFGNEFKKDDLQTRDDPIFWDSIWCPIDKRTALLDGVGVSLAILGIYAGHNYEFLVPPGPGYCIKVACGPEANIALCNDRTEYASIPARHIADNVRGVVVRCLMADDRTRVKGQIFSFDRAWNVIVHGDRAC